MFQMGKMYLLRSPDFGTTIHLTPPHPKRTTQPLVDPNTNNNPWHPPEPKKEGNQTNGRINKKQPCYGLAKEKEKPWVARVGAFVIQVSLPFAWYVTWIFDSPS